MNYYFRDLSLLLYLRATSLQPLKNGIKVYYLCYENVFFTFLNMIGKYCKLLRWNSHFQIEIIGRTSRYK